MPKQWINQLSHQKSIKIRNCRQLSNNTPYQCVSGPVNPHGEWYRNRTFLTRDRGRAWKSRRGSGMTNESHSKSFPHTWNSGSSPSWNSKRRAYKNKKEKCKSVNKLYVMFLGVISDNVHGECGKREPLADKSPLLYCVPRTGTPCIPPVHIIWLKTTSAWTQTPVLGLGQ